MSRLPVLLVGLAAVLAAPAAAHAELIVNGTLNTPKTTVDASTRNVHYYLDLRTTDQPERFSVRLTPRKFSMFGPFDEGQPIDGPRDISLVGAGNLGERVQDPAILPACSSRDERFHGYATGAVTVDVAMPANTASTLALRYFTGRRPPWADGDYRMVFDVQRTMVGTYGPESPLFGGVTPGVTPARRVTKGPTPGGRMGAHIILSTTPKGTTAVDAASRRVKRRSRVRIGGRLLPALKGKTVVVEVSRNGGQLRTVKRVKTTSKGRLPTVTWRPTRSGEYEIWARYPTQKGPLTSDKTSCPTRFVVK